jgi:hypothetical protein
MARALALPLIAYLLGACGEDDRPASWPYVYEAILEPSCTTSSCHTRLSAVGGVRLETPGAAYAILVGRPCASSDPAGEAPRNFVDPGHPERSRLLYLLRGDDVPLPMPPDRLLPYRDVELVERWIEEGATCD